MVGCQTSENTLTFTSGVTCHFTSLPRRNLTGEIIGTFGIGRDITQRLKTEKALKDSENRLRKAQSVAKIGNWEYDISTGRVWGSEEAFRIYGIERKTPFLPLYEVENYILEAKRVNQALVDLMAENAPYDIEFEIRPKGRQGITVIHSVAELEFDESGAPVKVLGVIQDITESKAKEKERLVLIEQLQQAQKMEALGTLAGGVAHDFNNILGIIMAYAELARLEKSDWEKGHEYLKNVLAASERAKGLVKQILAFSRQNKEALQHVSVKNIIDEIRIFLEASIPSFIEKHFKVASDLQQIIADPGQIQQVLMNLCTNAYHSMEENGGVLTISAEMILVTPSDPKCDIGLKPGPHICISVKDTGRGMDPETIIKIFEPYYTTKEVGKGSGLGLSVVYGIVRSHKGVVTVDSEPDKGSTFRIYLPAIKSESIDEEKQSSATLHGKERVLFVDDEKMLADSSGAMLEALGYTVISVYSAKQALAQFKLDPWQFDLVITDQTMPHMTGENLAAEILRIRPDMPVIIATGYSEKIDEQKAKAIGLKAFIFKPFSIKNLARMVREALDGE